MKNLTTLELVSKMITAVQQNKIQPITRLTDIGCGARSVKKTYRVICEEERAEWEEFIQILDKLNL